MKIAIVSIALILSIGVFFLFKKGIIGKPSHPAVHKINKDALSKKIKEVPSIQFVDVRTPKEFNKEYIEPAINIDFFDKDFVNQFKEYNKEEPLFLYCRSGNRSGKAAYLLAKDGFTEIYDLEGGILEWNKSK